MGRLVVFLLLVLVSFGATAAKLTGTLKKISDSGEFVIGYHENSPPFSFLDENGEPVGYALDLCRRIAAAVKANLDRTDIRVKFVPLTLENRFDAVQNGKVDIECAATTITWTRYEQVDFTIMTFVTGGSVLSYTGTGIKSMGDLSGKKVAVIKGTTNEASLVSYLDESLIDAKVVLADSDEDALGLLETSEVDAVASDQVVLIGQIVQSDDPGQFALSEDLFSFEPYGFMVRRNDADFRLVANRSLAQLYRTGQYRSLYNKWFGRIGIKPSPVLAAMYKLQGLPE